jgi:hypothetical protein
MEGADNLAFLAQQHRLVSAKTTVENRAKVPLVAQRAFAVSLKGNFTLRLLAPDC